MSKPIKAFAGCVLALAVAVFCLPLFGFTVGVDANVGRDGKANVSFSAVSELGKDEFKTRAEEYVEGYNNLSTATDCVKLGKITKTDGGYDVEVSFRRVDKVKAAGAFGYGNASEYSIEESEKCRQLRYWSNGDLHSTTRVAKGKTVNAVTIGRPRDGYGTDEILPRSSDGTVMDTDKFFSELSSVKGSVKIITFCLLDLDGVERVTVNFPGAVKYYAGQNIVKEGNTFELKPVKIKADINPSDGGDIISKTEINAIAGYVVFDIGPSPLLIALISVIAAAAAGGIAAFIVHVYKLGKRAIAAETEEEKEKEVEA